MPFFTLGSLNLEYQWHGPSPAEAPTLVLLHEGLGCVAMWKDFPQRLAEATNYGVLVYSRQGYGDSDPCNMERPVNYMHHEAQQVLPAVIAHFGLAQFCLVGHSDGGSITILYAGTGTAPGLIGIITEAPHVFCEDKTLESIRAAKTAYEHSDLRGKLLKYHHANVDCAFWGWNNAWLHPAFSHWNIEASLSDIQVPHLVIQGNDDEYGTHAQAESIKKHSNTEMETLLLDNCGHAPHRDQSEATLAAMTEFSQRLFAEKAAEQ